MKTANTSKPALVPNPKAMLRDQLRQVMRFHHYSFRTEQTYWQWIRRFLIFHRRPTRNGPGSNIGRITNARMLRQTCPVDKWKRSGRAPFQFDQETADSENTRSGQCFPETLVALFMRRCIPIRQ